MGLSVVGIAYQSQTVCSTRKHQTCQPADRAGGADHDDMRASWVNSNAPCDTFKSSHAGYRGKSVAAGNGHTAACNCGATIGHDRREGAETKTTCSEASRHIGCCLNHVARIFAAFAHHVRRQKRYRHDHAFRFCSCARGSSGDRPSEARTNPFDPLEPSGAFFRGEAGERRVGPQDILFLSVVDKEAEAPGFGLWHIPRWPLLGQQRRGSGQLFATLWRHEVQHQRAVVASIKQVTDNIQRFDTLVDVCPTSDKRWLQAHHVGIIENRSRQDTFNIQEVGTEKPDESSVQSAKCHGCGIAPFVWFAKFNTAHEAAPAHVCQNSGITLFE